MSTRREIRPEATVKARMHQLESAVASADHLSKHPDQLRKRQQRGKLYFESESDDDEGTSDFAELLKVGQCATGFFFVFKTCFFQKFIYWF